MKWYSLILSILLAGCIQLLPDAGEPAKKVFLTPTPLAKTKYTQHPRILSISRPQAFNDLASVKLRLIHLRNELPVASFIAGFEWEEKLPDLMQGYIVRSLEQSHLFKGVIKEDDNIKGDWRLIMDIRDFDVVNICDPYVSIEIEFKVVALPGHTLVAQRVFRYQQTLSCLTLPDILSAYSKSVEELLSDLEKWLAKLQEKDHLSTK